MKKSMRKDFRREVKKSFSRFISILLIVVLGVAFYSGIRSAMPAMTMTADAVYDKENLMDIRVVGTLGLTRDDLDAIKEIQGVEFAEGSRTTDFLCLVNSKEVVTKVIEMPETINDVRVVEGRYPEKYNECLVSKEFLEESELEVGSSVTLSTGNDDKVFDTLAAETYEIVGVGASSCYLNGDMGTSTIGDGMVDGYIVVPKEAFVTDYFTSIHITVSGAKALDSFGTEYSDLVARVKSEIKNIAERRCDIRYSEVRSKSNDLLEKARNDYSLAQITIQTEIENAEQELRDAETLLNAQKEAFEANKDTLEDAQKNLPTYEKEVAQAEKEVAKAEKELQNNEAKLQQIQDELDKINETLEIMREDPNTNSQELTKVEDSYTYLEGLYNVTEKLLITQRQQLNEAKTTLDARKAELEQVKALLGDNPNAVADAQAELDKRTEEIQRGYEQLEIKRQDAQEELDVAKLKLETAEREITNMTVPVWYVLDRNSIESHISFDNDAQSIGAIGMVFPIVFFIVAILVSLTTMTRMVTEQRAQIGTFKSLGYSKFAIARKYLLYAFLASVIGSVMGVFLGEYTIPYLVVRAYRMSYYNLGADVITLNAQHAIVASVIAVACTTFASLLACYKELRSVPATLMRPDSPKVGKRILLERFGSIWSRLNFGQKAAMRNLFRYKKRFLMTLFGVGGCMALLLVGFGIRDSVSTMANNQYNKVFTHSGIVSIDSTLTRSQRRAMLADVSDISDINSYLQATRSIVYANGESINNFENEKNAYLIVPRNVDDFKKYVNLKERVGEGLHIELTDDGVVITEKYASLLGVGVGDSIFIRKSESDSSPKEVKVIGVTENYIFNYIYMTPNLYQSVYAVAPDVNILMIDVADAADTEDISSRLLNIHGITAVTMNNDEAAELNIVIRNLSFIVIMMIVAAIMLAFIVLYNLNNINISERRRELATLKLLGFYNKEAATYVYRENIVLTILGTVLGVGLGIILHRFVMVTVETDIYMFGREIQWQSIVIAAVITIAFSMLVNGVMYFKIKKIDMIESLKSVE